MKALFFGGTGTISMAITRQLAENPDWELYLVNRGNRREIPENVKVIIADVNDEEDLKAKLSDMCFDVVCDFIGYVPAQIERDLRLFKGKTKQFMYISSASAYQTPPASYLITEATPLANPLWEYSRNKIACEELLIKAYREEGFPITIIRPSHTYDERNLPIGVDGRMGCYQVLKRMLDGKPVIIPGDGTSLWTVTFNEDMAGAFIGLMGNVHAIGEAYQITSDETLTWNQIYQIIADALGVELHPYYVPSDFLAAVCPWDIGSGLLGDKSNSVVFDNRKVKTAVPEWQPRIRFDQGARKAVSYILSHPERQLEDPEFDAWCDRVIDAMEKAKAALTLQ